MAPADDWEAGNPGLLAGVLGTLTKKAPIRSAGVSVSPAYLVSANSRINTWVGSLYVSLLGHGRPRGRNVDCRPSRFAVCFLPGGLSKRGTMHRGSAQRPPFRFGLRGLNVLHPTTRQCQVKIEIPGPLYPFRKAFPILHPRSVALVQGVQAKAPKRPFAQCNAR